MVQAMMVMLAAFALSMLALVPAAGFAAILRRL